MPRCTVFGGDKRLSMEFNKIKKLAKVDLHCHLDGSISMAALRLICEKQEIELPQNDEDLEKLITVSQDCKSLSEYLSKFKVFGKALKEKLALKVAAFDLICQAAKENIIYIEVRFSPILSIKEGLTAEEIIESVIEGLELGKEKYGVEYGILLCCLRGREDKENLEIIRLAEIYKNKKVCGVDLAGNESKYPNELYGNIFKTAKQKKLNITIHSGECGNAQNVITAIEMGAKRIGHGLALANNDDLQDKVLGLNTILEMCPTSNIQTNAVTNWGEYPIKEFMKKGISVCVNTDNRTVSGTSLTQEFHVLSENVDFNYSDMLETTINAVKFAFIDEEIKIKLLKEVYKSYEKEIGKVPNY